MINIIFVFVEAEIRKNAELTTLAEEFRLYANELVDMLDGRVPFVSRFKVRFRFIHVREVRLWNHMLINCQMAVDNNNDCT